MLSYLLAIYCLSPILRRDPIVHAANAMRPVPLRPHVPHGRICLGAPKDAGAAPSHIRIRGMVSYAPASFHDLMDDEVESDGSSIGDVMAPSHPLSWECTMVDALGQSSVVAESL